MSSLSTTSGSVGAPGSNPWGDPAHGGLTPWTDRVRPPVPPAGGAREVRTMLAGWRPPGATLPADLLAEAEAAAAIDHQRELAAA